MQDTAVNKVQSHSPFKGFLPFFWLALACILGVVLADWLTPPTWVWAGGTLLSCLLWLITLLLPKSLTFTHRLKQWTGSDKRLPTVILIAIFCIGGWRYAASRPVITPAHAAYYNDRSSVQMIGIVVKPPDVRESTINLIVAVESLRTVGADNATILSDVVIDRVVVLVNLNVS